MSTVDILLAEKKHEQAIIKCVNAAYGMYIERMGKKPAPMLSVVANPVPVTTPMRQL